MQLTRPSPARRPRPSDLSWWVLASIWLHLPVVVWGIVARLRMPALPEPEPLIVEVYPVYPVEPLPAPTRGIDAPDALQVGRGTAPAHGGRPLPPAPPPGDHPDAAPPQPGAAVGESVVLLPEERGPVDPVEALRTALGWGPLDRSRLPERGPDDGPGGTAGPDEAPTQWQTPAELSGTPMGRYVAELERLIARRWSELDLTVHERASGISGRVVLRYRIWPDGRITDRSVVSSSGTIAIDNLAWNALPPRAPRFPRDMPHEEPLWHQIALRYNNPLVVARPR